MCGGEQGDEAEKEAASRTLVAMLEAVRIVAVLLAPITPAMSQRIFDQLAITDVRDALPVPPLPPHTHPVSCSGPVLRPEMQ